MYDIRGSIIRENMSLEDCEDWIIYPGNGEWFSWNSNGSGLCYLIRGYYENGENNTDFISGLMHYKHRGGRLDPRDPGPICKKLLDQGNAIFVNYMYNINCFSCGCSCMF